MKNEFIKRLKYNVAALSGRNKKISEISPNKTIGMNLINKADGDKIIDQIIEEPLRKVCRELRNKGIETVMSSANKNNLLKKDEQAVEREDVEGRRWFLDAPTYESAGKGYAWIMLNYSSLADGNKEILFSLEQEKDSNGNNIGRKIVWFVKDDSFMNIFNRGEEIEEKSELDRKFEERSFDLMYNSDRYPKRVVFLRMPINEATTVANVEEYFEKLVQRLRQQQVEMNAQAIDRSEK